jgi:hypothetical protein
MISPCNFLKMSGVAKQMVYDFVQLSVGNGYANGVPPLLLVTGVTDGANDRKANSRIAQKPGG